MPPHNLEAEESLLGAMMLSRDALTAAVEARLGPADFYKPAHGHVFEAAWNLHSQGEPVDPVTVAEELRRAGLLDGLGGRSTLLRIQAATPASANAVHYADIVRELSLLRRLIGVGSDIAEMGYAGDDDVAETLDRAEAMVFEVAEHRVADTMTPIFPALEATMNELERLYDRDGELVGSPTGFGRLDEILLGLHPSNLVVVAARPGQGKTAFALGASMNVAMATQKPVLFFSMEMGHLELTKRLLAAEARVDARKLATGKLTEAEWPRVSQAVGRLAEAPFFIDDNPHCTVMEMRAKARRVKARYGDVGLIVVDYLQLMSSSRSSESRQVEVSEMSRGLKILARELDAPVMALSQLNRQLEYRNDKRPMLADLRESGCLTARTRVARADTGEWTTMGELLATGATDIAVWTLDEHYRLVPATMTNVFASGVKPVFELRLASGRAVEASGNHPFLTLDGWQRLDQLSEGDRIAVARQLPEPRVVTPLDPDELVLLAHLIGDGCHLAHHALQYTTTDRANADAVVAAARRRFGIEARVVHERTWIQVYLRAPERLARGRRNPIAEWLDGLGLFDRRSWEKFVPTAVFRAPARDVAAFLHHLWATDGSVTTARSGAVRVYYASTSRRLADDVAALLLRLDIRARVRRVHSARRSGFTVDVSGVEDQRRFLRLVGVHGQRAARVEEAICALEGRCANPNVDTIPRAVWEHIRHKVMPALDLSGRDLARRLGMSYCGSTLYDSDIGRARMARLADALPDPLLRDLATSDVLWDRVVEVVPLGPQPVYDATVPGTANFLAEGVVVHNSIEQDADVVMFIYRDEYYNPESDQRGVAEIIVAKHRNGPTGNAQLAFLDYCTKFANMARE